MNSFMQLLIVILTSGFLHIAGSVRINYFKTPEIVKSGEDFFINCSVTLTDEEKVNAELILTKDGSEFYRYSKKLGQPMITSISGINDSQIETSNKTPGFVKILNANFQTQGSYSCSIYVNVINNRYIRFDAKHHHSQQHSPSNSSKVYTSYICLIFELLICKLIVKMF